MCVCVCVCVCVCERERERECTAIDMHPSICVYIPLFPHISVSECVCVCGGGGGRGEGGGDVTLCQCVCMSVDPIQGLFGLYLSTGSNTSTGRYQRPSESALLSCFQEHLLST